MEETSGISSLHKEIDRFIHRFYTNELIRGLFLFSSALILSFLFVTCLEYIGEFSSWIRFVFLFGFFSLNAFFFFSLIIRPILKKWSLTKRMDRYDASRLIGKLFPEISDRLLNTLQLQDSLLVEKGNVDLLRASISQKTLQLKVFSFSHGIDYKVNKKYTKYLLPGIITLLTLGVFIPSILTQGTKRILDFNKEFLPFIFELENTKSTIEEGNDIPVNLLLKGTKLPEQVYIISDQGKFLMKKVRKNRFSYDLKKVLKNGTFYFEANEYVSQKYSYTVNGKSVIGKCEVKVVYPKYLGRNPEIIRNVGDLEVPEGAELYWTVSSKNTSSVNVEYNSGKKENYKTPLFSFKSNAKASYAVKFTMLNRFSNKSEVLIHNVNIIKDAYPTIQVEENSDSLSEGVRYFTGLIGDDFGLEDLSFYYNINREGKIIKSNKINIQKNKGTKSNFSFAVDFRREEVKLNDKIEYFFIVRDNDGVNGSKSSKSFVGTYQLPSLKELNEQHNEQQQITKQELEKVLERAKNFQKAVEKLKKEASNSKTNDWNKQQQIQQLQEEQKSVSESLQKIKENLERASEEKTQLSEIDKELLEKQELIEKLLDQVMDDELRKLLEEIEKMFEKNEKNEMLDKIDKLNQTAEDRKKQLERSIEMLKKLQVNEKIDDIEKELKENAADQKELKKEIEKNELNKEEAQKKQEEINKRFEEIQKKLEELKKLNSELSQPMNVENTESLEKDINESLSKASENLQEGKNGKAGPAQQSAAEQMEQMADQLNSQQEESNNQQEEEDMEMLRQILESLMILSFDQENVIGRFNKVSTNDPNYKKVGRLQVKINSDTRIVKDSLLALAKRQPKVASFIDKELNDIELAQENTIEAIDDHDKAEIVKYEQQIMTSYNNLALLLNEALQQMQSQSQMPGSGSCNKPGKGKPKPGSGMSSGDMKQQLKKQLEQMQKGANPGGKQPGDKPGSNQEGQGMNMMGLGNKEIAKMAAEQTAIRQRIQELKNELNKDGKGEGNKLNPLIQELERQEKDLINKRFGSEMIKRQKDIMTRLLESEKAVIDRGFEDKRESKSGKDGASSNLIELKEYNKAKLKQIELLRSVDPSFSRYYKSKAEEYFNVSN